MKIHPLLGTTARMLGKLLLLPILTTLILLLPIVSFICCFLMFGGMFAAIAFEVSAVGPKFPFLVVFGMSLAFGLFLLLYHALIWMLLRN